MTDWMKQAACRGMNPAIFVPERGDMDSFYLAIRTCNTCEVIEQCATTASNSTATNSPQEFTAAYHNANAANSKEQHDV